MKKELIELIDRYKKEWDWYGMGSATSYSSIISDLERLQQTEEPKDAEEYLYDKVNKREARLQYFKDQDGNYWIDTDPRGIDMGGKVRIIRIGEDHPQYEVKQTDFANQQKPTVTDEEIEERAESMLNKYGNNSFAEGAVMGFLNCAKWMKQKLTNK